VAWGGALEKVHAVTVEGIVQTCEYMYVKECCKGMHALAFSQ